MVVIVKKPSIEILESYLKKKEQITEKEIELQKEIKSTSTDEHSEKGSPKISAGAISDIEKEKEKKAEEVVV